MTDLKTCTEQDSEELNTWLLSTDEVSELTGYELKEICFAKAEDTLLNFYTPSPCKKFWNSLKEKM